MTYAGIFFLTGLVSSIHCIGMCGTFSASLLAGSPSPSKLQLSILAGRSLSYILLGAISGGAGSALFYETTMAKLLLGIFSISAGLYGIMLIRGRGSLSLPPLLRGIFRWLIPVETPIRAFTVGLITPALPCPMLHTALALSVLSGGAIGGSVSMALFAAGTALPLLISSVVIERLINKTGGYHIKAAGGVLLMTSLFSLGRLAKLFSTGAGVE